MSASRRRDAKPLCPVTDIRGGTTFICSLPRDHIKLQSVKDGDRPSKFRNMLSPHNFVSRNKPIH